MTQTQIDNRTSDYVCYECGEQFLTEKQKNTDDIVTANLSMCGLCGHPKLVTHIRHYNWLFHPSHQHTNQ